jgi:hypothetical protein
MKIFYWVMAVLVLGTFIPSVMFVLIYAVTGAPESADRARTLWNISRVFTLAAINILIWGHVIVALWRIWFP